MFRLFRYLVIKALRIACVAFCCYQGINVLPDVLSALYEVLGVFMPVEY